MVQSSPVPVSELFHRPDQFLSSLVARIPQLATGAGLGSWQVAVVALVAGIALLLAGVRLGRVLSAIAGAALGWVMATRYPVFANLLGIPAGTAAWVVAATAGFGCAFAPALYPILMGALPGAAWGAGVGLPFLGRRWFAMVGAAAVAALICFAARRLVLALTAACSGVVLIDAALLVLAVHFPVVRAVTGRPMLLALLTVVLLVAGTASQVSHEAPGGRGSLGGSDAPRRGKRARGIEAD